MLKCGCGCGWRGINLVPHPEDDTAGCPDCNTVFKEITAEKAVITSPEGERKLVQMPEVLEALKDLIFPETEGGE